MAGRALNGGMCRPQVEFGTAGMTTGASGNRLDLLLFLMAARTRESRHRSFRLTNMTGGAFRGQPSPAPVTLIAAELGMLSAKRPWVLKFFRRGNFRRFRDGCFLANDGMAQLALPADHLPFPARMIAFMTAEAAGI
jgi:hypothetical protein